MALLFSDFHTDPSDEVKKPKKRQSAAVPQADDVPAFEAPVRREHRILGQIEDVHRCADESCNAGIHDIIDESGGFWLIECVFCGTGQRVKAIRGHLKPKEDVFTFQSGDYAGMTIDEVCEDARGRAYVEWAADEHKVQAVRDACRKRLDAISATA